MNRRSKPFSRKSRRGVTLIEVLAGLIVLAVLISSIAVARGRLLRQDAEARRKTAAADAVDRMLATWVGGAGQDDAMPVPARGDLQGVDGCTWRTSWAPVDAGAARVGAGVVRVEVLSGANRVLAVEVLKHLPLRAERGTR
jgi:prepilin-type N-terminal cleavage/methylation domain-containing protein